MKAIFLAVLLVLLLGYIFLALTGYCKDNLGGPFMAITFVTVLVLGVGLGEWLTSTERAPDQDQPPMPRLHPSLIPLYREMAKSDRGWA